MKIYLYDEESGLYLGEDFIDTSEVVGACELPENATLVRPPETGSNQVAVFIKESNRWNVRNKGSKPS